PPTGAGAGGEREKDSPMQKHPQPRSPAKGLWWKALLAAWLGLSGIGAVAAALGRRLPGELGFPVLVIGWVTVWVIWRRKVVTADRPRGTGAIGALQRIWAAFCVAVFSIGVVVLILHNEAGLNRTGVSAEVVAGGVALIGVVSLVGGRVWVPQLDGSDRGRLVQSFHNRFFARMAWAEAPALLAFGGFLLLGGEPWIYLIGLTASLAGFAWAAPTPASLHRDQEQLDASGRALDLREVLGRPRGPEPSGEFH
ncbi:MAG: hypothetical protein Q8K72_07400, partial [Acidimicrobiales bacterium]|nr:hypothetical protein [Acidimicrobiales bacterium]